MLKKIKIKLITKYILGAVNSRFHLQYSTAGRCFLSAVFYRLKGHSVPSHRDKQSDIRYPPSLTYLFIKMASSSEGDCSQQLPELQMKFNIIPKTVAKPFSDLFAGYMEGLVKSEPGGTVMPTAYSRDRNAEIVFQFEPRRDDVWVVTFPKCGNTNNELNCKNINDTSIF